jgi:hypothetical protein
MVFFNSIFMYAQADMDRGPSPLGSLNTLGLTVFLVGIGFLLLLSIHYYRMRDTVKKDKSKKSKNREVDMISQLEYMSRDELKAMILKERNQREEEIKAAFDAEILPNEENSAVPEKGKELLLSFGKPPAEKTGQAQGSEINQLSLFEPAEKKKISPDVDLIAKLVIPPEEEIKKEKMAEEMKLKKGANPNPPYKDQVQRSALSNELPEEFRRKSRRI